MDRRTDCSGGVSAVTVINRYAEPQPSLPAGTDDHRPGHGLLEPHMDVRVGEPGSARPVHFSGGEIDATADQGHARRPEPDRRRQTGVRTPSRDLRQIESAPAFVNRGDCRHPSQRRSAPAPRIRSEGAGLVLPGHDRHVDAGAAQAPDRDRGIAGSPALDGVAPRRQPQCQAMEPPARPPVSDVR